MSCTDQASESDTSVRGSDATDALAAASASSTVPKSQDLSSESVDTDPGVELLYDHAKHLLSLSLLGIGGIMSLTQSAVGQRIESIITAMLIMLFAGSGLCSLSVIAAILRAARSGEAAGTSPWMLNQGAMGFLGAGVAVFFIAWVRVIL